MLEGGRITSFLLLLAQTSGYAPSIVITGGPCSGKTSAIESLPSSIAGFEIIKVPEAATLSSAADDFPSAHRRIHLVDSAPWIVTYYGKVG